MRDLQVRYTIPFALTTVLAPTSHSTAARVDLLAKSTQNFEGGPTVLKSMKHIDRHV